MNSSRIILAAGLFCLAASAARAAEPTAEACPDLSGKFECPAVERYKQKAMTITVKSDPAAKTYAFAYDDGSPAVAVAANGKKKRGANRKTWSSYVCFENALVQLVFKDANAVKSTAGSKQRLNKDGDYEVSGPDGKITLVCRRAK